MNHDSCGTMSVKFHEVVRVAALGGSSSATPTLQKRGPECKGELGGKRRTHTEDMGTRAHSWWVVGGWVGAKRLNLRAAPTDTNAPHEIGVEAGQHLADARRHGAGGRIEQRVGHHL
jgi:hypothetical protein